MDHHEFDSCAISTLDSMLFDGRQFASRGQAEECQPAKGVQQRSAATDDVAPSHEQPKQPVQQRERCRQFGYRLTGDLPGSALHW